MLSVVTVSLFLFIDEEVEHEKEKGTFIVIQTLEVDAVSGAALTSDTVLKAMENALK